MKLWQKNYSLNKEIEKFTVGNDYLLDKKLMKYDCIASIAHAKMLKKIGLLDKKELEEVVVKLQKVIANGLVIKQEDEDCHTEIENYLREVGKKIHTARSRNDQIKAALHLYMKDELGEIKGLVKLLVSSLKKIKNCAIPGYTHTQKAMPSSFKLWKNAFIASMEDNLELLNAVTKIVDKNPLGSAAGYGVSFEINKEITKKELGFSENQEIGYVQNSRGKFEALVVNLLVQIMMDLNKISSDMILYNLLGFVKLPDEFTTGSSIMPQKKNPDVLELVRAKYSIVLGYEMQIKGIVGNLISGYHRDYQLTKEPLMKSIKETKNCLKIMSLVLANLKIDQKKCKKAMTTDLYATEKVYELVKKGSSFREAYKKIKQTTSSS